MPLSVLSSGLLWAVLAVSSVEQAPAPVAAPDVAGTPPTVKLAVLKDHAAKKVKPSYPAMAKAAHVGGTVTVGVEVDASGKVTTAVILSGPELLRSAAIEAAKQWEFKPVEVNGVPSVVRSAIQFNFVALTGAVSY